MQIDSGLLSANLRLSLEHLTQRTHFLFKITQILECYYRSITLYHYTERLRIL